MNTLKPSTALAIRMTTKILAKKFGHPISTATQQEVLDYCKRKLVCIKKDEDYLPLLYKCELPIFINRTAITDYSVGVMYQRKESIENVRNMPTASVFNQMPQCS